MLEDDFKEIEEKVASEEMESITDLDDLVEWFYQFGDLRKKQLEDVMDEFPHNEELVAKCREGIDNINKLQSFK